MKKLLNIVRWIGVGIFGIMALSSLVQGGFFATLLFFFGGAIIAPLEIISMVRSKLKLNKIVSIVLAVVLLFAGVLATPTSEIPADTNEYTQISGIGSTDNSEETTNKSTSTKEETTSKKDTTSESTDNSNPVETNKNETQPTACLHPNTSLKNKSIATCTDSGYTGDTYCTTCNKVIKNGFEIKATGHDTEIRNKKDATTTNEGYTGDTFCKVCETKIKSGKAVPKIVNNTQQETNSVTVYVTETGKKYHSTKSCSGLSRAKAIYNSTLQGAKNRGLEPCSKCY